MLFDNPIFAESDLDIPSEGAIGHQNAVLRREGQLAGAKPEPSPVGAR
jgi:hypothetical protein